MGTCFSSSSSSRTRMEDYYYYPALYDYDKGYTPYARNLHLQEALSSSLVSSIAETNHYPQLHRRMASPIKQKEPEKKTEKKPAEPSRWLCMICMDEKSPSDIFRGTTSCTHYYCTECTVRYVMTKIEGNIAMIKCPDVDCTRLLEPYTCRNIIPGDLFERWDKALCESLIVSSEKVYCPFEDCSAMMVVDDDDDQGDEVTETECPSCHRLFCAQCKVTWHAGIGCEEFQRGGNTKKKKKSSDEEDAMLIQMANKKHWRRCPSCKFYVEKIDGCVHMSCRCGFKFCYRCGAASSYSHACHIRSLILK
ncbi:probable E3 ubiquitin-protein ligase RNF217 [Brassica rapa]|uniref:RBR-type E3 ubiquitin transferase n=1 Tax=Brassica campestris TaxID=3711 RepID=M4CBG3_BRACM|nr:probable E3 ubiquitin-protein ligase RNF217 [Brassica rapa]